LTTDADERITKSQNTDRKPGRALCARKKNTNRMQRAGIEEEKPWCWQRIPTRVRNTEHERASKSAAGRSGKGGTWHVRCVAQESDVDSCTAGKQWEPSRILRALGVLAAGGTHTPRTERSSGRKRNSGWRRKKRTENGPSRKKDPEARLDLQRRTKTGRTALLLRTED
jgi:hypothetical protein